MFYAITKGDNTNEAEVHDFITANEAIAFTQEPENQDIRWIIVQDYNPNDPTPEETRKIVQGLLNHKIKVGGKK